MSRQSLNIFELNWFDRFLDYWREPIIQDLTRNERIRYGIYVFIAICGSNILVDLVSGVPFGPISLIINAAVKSSVYMIGLVSSEIAITYYSKKRHAFTGISIGKIWLISLVGYVSGYLLLGPYREHFGHLEYHGTDSSLVFFFQISPIWILLTYFYIQLHVRKSLRNEMDRLQQLNQLTAEKEKQQEEQGNEKTEQKPENKVSGTVLKLVDNGLPVEIASQAITHICVEEHYCTVQYFANNQLRQLEVKCPLKDFSSQLPEGKFVQIHRSCLVNVDHIMSVKKIPRSYELRIRGTDAGFSISRYRLSEVMPFLAQRSDMLED